MTDLFDLGSQGLPYQDLVLKKKIKMDLCSQTAGNITRFMPYHAHHTLIYSSKITQYIQLQFCKELPFDLKPWYFLFQNKYLCNAAATVILFLIVLPWLGTLYCYILQISLGTEAWSTNITTQSSWRMFCGLSAECPQTAAYSSSPQCLTCVFLLNLPLRAIRSLCNL